MASLGGIDTNLVVALDALLTEQGVTRAARRVGLGQSSMSHALSRLRDHFGDPLLVPAGRRMVLTERARALTQPAAAAVAQLGRVFGQREPFDPATSQRRFRLLSSDNLAFFLLPPLLALLAKEAPRVELRMGHLPEEWQGALRRGECDLKLGRKSRAPAGLAQEELLEEELVCVGRARHPALRGKLTLERYAQLGHVLVAPTAAPGAPDDALPDLMGALLQRRGLERRVALVVPHFLVAPFVVARCDLVTLASRRLVATLPASLRQGLTTAALPPPAPRYQLSQVWSEALGDDPGHRFLRGAVARAARSLPGLPKLSKGGP